jgi:hypothetical protein
MITLNEEKARLWLAQQADAVAEGEDYDVDIDAKSWEPRDVGEETTAVHLVWQAQQENTAVLDGLDGREIGLVYEATDDGGSYFFYVDFPTTNPMALRVASPYGEEWRRIGDRDALGIDAALSILGEAVHAANAITIQLAGYINTHRETA